MKKQVFLIMALTLVQVNISLAQHEVIYNFLTSDSTSVLEFPDGKAINYKSTSVIKIKNINRLLYDITVKGENIELNSETPEVFKLFFNTTKFSDDEVSDVKAQEDSQQDKIVGLTQSESENIKAYNKTLASFKNAIRDLEETKTAYDNIYITAYTDGQKGKSIIEDLRKLSLLRMQKPTKAELMNECNKRIATFNKSYKEVKQAYEKLNITAKEIVKESYNDVNDMKEKVEKFKYDQLFSKMALLYEKATSTNTYEYISSPIIAQKDYINYSIEIKPKSDLKNVAADRNEKFEIPVSIRYGWKIDFSTGVFFGSNDIEDQKYHTASIENDTINVVIKRNRRTNSFKPALGAMMHISPRFARSFTPAISLGLGLNSTNISDAVYCLGASLIAGKDERLILSFGAMGARVDVLKGNYVSGQQIKKSAIDSDSDLVEKGFRVGYFVGITYNLTNKKKGQ